MALYDSGATYDSGARYDEVAAPLRKKSMIIKLGLDKLSATEKVAKGRSIHSAMVTNAATFPNASPTMPELLAMVNAADAGIVAAEAAIAASKQAIVQRDQLLETMCAGLMRETGYVQVRANGDPAIVGLAGMEVRAASTPVGPMPKVLDLKLTISDHFGEIDWMCKPVKGAASYIIQINTVNPDTQSEWKYAASSSKSSGTLRNLTAGRIWVRVCAKGADEQDGAWSDPAEELVR